MITVLINGTQYQIPQWASGVALVNPDKKFTATNVESALVELLEKIQLMTPSYGIATKLSEASYVVTIPNLTKTVGYPFCVVFPDNSTQGIMLKVGTTGTSQSVVDTDGNPVLAKENVPYMLAWNGINYVKM